MRDLLNVTGSDVGDSLANLAEAAGSDAVPDGLRPWLAVVIAVGVALVITVALSVLLYHLVLRKNPVLRADVRHSRLPLFLVLSFAGSVTALKTVDPDAKWHVLVDFLLFVGLIASFAWLLVVVLQVLESALLAKYRRDLPNPRSLAKLRTQVSLLRRVATAVVLVLGVSAVLLLVPQVRALGAGLLASAGLVSVVAGLAVQSALTNVFAGLQLAFTDAIRVDDTVFVEAKQGAIEEITLTYVVVKLTDDRRMILPSSYFTATPFENWSRGSSELSGSVMLELNWNAPVEKMRLRLQQLLDASDLWDGRNGSLNVVDAVGGIMTISIFVSARTAGDLYELRNYVREHLVGELQRDHPEVLPKPVGQRPGV